MNFLIETKVSLWILLASVAIVSLVAIIAVIVARLKQRRIFQNLPYEVGSIYPRDNDNGNGSKDFITVNFDAKLVLVDKSQDTYTVFQILDRFWENPAEELNHFYNAGNKFGIQLPIEDLVKTREGKFRFVVSDKLGNRYRLVTKYVPDEYFVTLKK